MPRGKKEFAESISQTVTGQGRGTTVLKAAEKIEPAPDGKVPTQNPEKLSVATSIILGPPWGACRPGGHALHRVGFSQSQCWVASYRLLASTMAVMPARTAAGSCGHASTTCMRAVSAGSLCTSVCPSLGDPAFPSGFSGLGSGLQIRHRRFDSDRSLSPKDPCEVPTTAAFAGVFLFVGVLVSEQSATRTDAPECIRLTWNAGLGAAKVSSPGRGYAQGSSSVRRPPLLRPPSRHRVTAAG